MKRHLIRRLFRHLFRTAWWQPNRASRKMLREEADKLIGWDKESNPAWAKTWKYFIKRQHPWWGLIELNQFKIIEMRDYMQNRSYLAEEEVARQMKEMTEIVDLGAKIMADEYSNEAHNFMIENSIPITIIYKKHPENKEEDFYCNLRDEVARLYDHDFFDVFLPRKNYSPEATKRRQEYLKDKDTRDLKEWLEANNLTKQDIITAYSTDWIDPSYCQKWMEMEKKATQDKQKDIKKYFKLIAERYEAWGD